MPKITQETVNFLNKRIKEYYDAHWDALIESGCFSSSYEKKQKEPIDASKFAIHDFIVVPYHTGEVIATVNLELIKSVEYQEAEAKVYRKIDIAKPAYFIYGHENSLPVLFEWK